MPDFRSVLTFQNKKEFAMLLEMAEIDKLKQACHL